MMPNSRFKVFWNIVIILLLLYTATVTPYRTAFIDETSTFMFYFELLTDFLFFLDIIVNFLSAFEGEDGEVVDSYRVIARKYITSWFVLDLIACIPFQIIFRTEQQSNGGYNKLLRLMRLPRLYRMLRIIRLFKIVKMVQNSPRFQAFLEKIKLNNGTCLLLAVGVDELTCSGDAHGHSVHHLLLFYPHICVPLVLGGQVR